MARIRSIKPEFWRSPSTAAASPLARLLYIAMWNWCDDYGVGEWTPRELLGFAFPHDDEVTNAEFQCLCTEVATCFGTVFYVIDGRRFYYIPAWDKHQKNERRAVGKYPLPDDPNAYPDQAFSETAEKRGSSVHSHGDTASGTGNREQGNREQGNRGMVAERDRLGPLFDAAWDSWPKKVKREEARARFMAAAKAGVPESLACSIAMFGDAYAATTEKQFIPALASWIFQKRWTDELPTANASPVKVTAAQRNLDTVAHFVALDAKAISA